MSAKVTLPHYSVVTRWNEEKVIKWLKKVNLNECIPIFEIRRIDGAKLLELTEQKLFTYQDMKIKHRKQIAKCVQECKSQASNAKRIAKNLKQGQGSSHSHSVETNGTCDSDDDFDDWGSDFEDSDDEVVSEGSLEVNNNSIIPPSPECELKSSGSYPVIGISQEKSIPKPPDISIVPKSVRDITDSTILRNSNQTTSVPRPPLKRPPSQPPPPPVSQVLNQEEPQEDYEIPIASSPASANISSSSLHTTVNEATVIETYEIVEAPEENYEIVDPPVNMQNMSEKPVLPPRYLKSPGSVSPPPLPQKPLRLKENLLVSERPDVVKTFCRPKLPIKSNCETSPEISPPTTSSFISTLMGRRSSTTPTSSPKTHHRGNDEGMSTSPSSMNMLSASRSSLSSASDAQNMATRPLPPVPIPKSDEKPIENVVQDIHNYPWFHEIEREDAEAAVKKLTGTGSFVVRPSKRAGKENPYSLTVLHEGKLFHLNIRQRGDHTYALGKEKEKEKTFSTVAELIAYHQNEPILLKNRGEPAGKTKLCKYPEKT